MKRYEKVKLKSWEQIATIAEFCDVGERSVYNIAVGFKPWRTANPMVVRHLYGAGWSPAGGRAAVKRWLDQRSEDAQKLATALLDAS